MATEKGSGFNESNWRGEIACVGDASRNTYGCGTPFDITRDDLYSVTGRDIGGNYRRTIFRCPKCGNSTQHPQGEFFKGLPSRAEWLAAHPEPPTHPDICATPQNPGY